MQQDTSAAFQERFVFIGISLLCYAAACVSPCLEMFKQGVDVWYGARILVIGWLGLLVGQFAWLANPLWAVGLLFLTLRRPTIALIASALALLLALQTFMLFGMPLPGDEGGVTKLELLRLRYGFYLWLASLLALFAGTVMLRTHSRK